MSNKTKNKLYLYLFHLFESLISNVTHLVTKSVNSVFHQIGLQEELAPKGDGIKDTINTIHSASEAISSINMNSKDAGANQPGFFSENAKLL